MKKHMLLIVLTFVLLGSGLSAQISDKLAIGFQLSQYQRDFGFGLNITSPHFANDKIAVRLRSNLMYNQHPDGLETTWTPYFNLSLGVLGVSTVVNDWIRLYGEGGVLFLFPNDEFSSESLEVGGYGLFGFEFYMAERSNYFIEIGGAGIGAQADEIIQSPIYSNGLIIQVGFRMHL
jgi:hypothetical protein